MKKMMKGFTLIELMIVVAIIGILAAVAIPKFADLVVKSKEAGVKATLGSLRSALSIYYGDTEGVYPSNLYTSITTDAKYMPQLSGVASLGKFELPAHKQSIGHATALYTNASAVGAVLQAGSANTGDDTTPLLYHNVNTESQWGDTLINCGHKDTKGNVWTSY